MQGLVKEIFELERSQENTPRARLVRLNQAALYRLVQNPRTC